MYTNCTFNSNLPNFQAIGIYYLNIHTHLSVITFYCKIVLCRMTSVAILIYLIESKMYDLHNLRDTWRPNVKLNRSSDFYEDKYHKDIFPVNFWYHGKSTNLYYMYCDMIIIIDLLPIQHSRLQKTIRAIMDLNLKWSVLKFHPNIKYYSC